MKKQLFLAAVLVFVLVGTSGCRLPLLDPPILGRWSVEGGQFFDEYWTFWRNNTGEAEYRIEFGGTFIFTDDFMWSYNRLRHILIMDGREYRVRYNLFQTEATLHDPEDDSVVVKLILQSTPVFRL